MTGPFIAAPRPVNNGRGTVYDVIDTAAYDPAMPCPVRFRSRLGTFEDEHQALALVEVLNGAEAVYRATLAHLDKQSAF